MDSYNTHLPEDYLPPEYHSSGKKYNKNIYFTDLGSQRCPTNDSLTFLKIICPCVTTFIDRLFSFCLMGEFLASTFLWLSVFPENQYRTSWANLTRKCGSDPLSHQHQWHSSHSGSLLQYLWNSGPRNYTISCNITQYHPIPYNTIQYRAIWQWDNLTIWQFD